MACGILIPQPGIEPTPPALEAWNLNHWTAREVPGKFSYGNADVVFSRGMPVPLMRTTALALVCNDYLLFSLLWGGEERMMHLCGPCFTSLF